MKINTTIKTEKIRTTREQLIHELDKFTDNRKCILVAIDHIINTVDQIPEVPAVCICAKLDESDNVEITAREWCNNYDDLGHLALIFVNNMDYKCPASVWEARRRELAEQGYNNLLECITKKLKALDFCKD